MLELVLPVTLLMLLPATRLTLLMLFEEVIFSGDMMVLLLLVVVEIGEGTAVPSLLPTESRRKYGLIIVAFRDVLFDAEEEEEDESETTLSAAAAAAVVAMVVAVVVEVVGGITVNVVHYANSVAAIVFFHGEVTVTVTSIHKFVPYYS